MATSPAASATGSSLAVFVVVVAGGAVAVAGSAEGGDFTTAPVTWSVTWSAGAC